MKLSLTMFILMFTSACSQLYTGRSYLSEMGHDDTSYFNPGADFPVMAGDTGRSWRTEKEQMKRTPASEEDLAISRGQKFLKDELKMLEDSQNEHSLKLYDKYREKLGSVSEKIYFLRLSSSEKSDYLQSRGFMDNSPKYLTPFERMSVLKHSNIAPGMSKDQVKDSWGDPVRVEVAGNPSFENERWVYSYNGAMKYIYFESGKVDGWE